MNPDIAERVLGKRPVRVSHVGGGAAGSVDRLHFADGSTLISKQAAVGLDTEAASLRLLAERSALPVPRVVHVEPGLLIMQDIPGRTGCHTAEEHAAELLAELHAVTSPDGQYGLHFDNTIGPLPQVNTWRASWPEFFGECRLLAMSRAAAREGAIPVPLADRLESLAKRLNERLPLTPAASLMHGDLWSGNILSAGTRVTGFIDPSPSYGHAEVELAFIRLFSTLGQEFEREYRACRGVTAADWREFEQTRCAIYNLYPLLVHARLFGGHYTGEVASALDSLGV